MNSYEQSKTQFNLYNSHLSHVGLIQAVEKLGKIVVGEPSNYTTTNKILY